MYEALRGPLGPAAKEFSICAVGGCGRTVLARSLCAKHYQAAYRDQSLPPKGERLPPKVSIKTTVSQETEAKLMQYARRTGRTVSHLMRVAIEQYIAERGD